MGLLDKIINAKALRSNGLLGLQRAPGNGLGIAPYGVRHDGMGAKGKGFLGLLQTPRPEEQATEYSMGVDINGKQMEIPSIVPTLNPAELKQVLGGDVSDDAYRKAVEHAMMRLKSGMSPFIGNTELRQTPGMADRMGIGAPQTYNKSLLAQGERMRENKFQHGIKATPWYSEFVESYGEPPDLNTPDYNYRAAWAAGIRPEINQHDGKYHWASSLPNGQMLKAENHPTAWKEHFMRATGKDPDSLGIPNLDAAQQYLRSNMKGELRE